MSGDNVWIASQYMDTDEWGVLSERNQIIVPLRSGRTRKTAQLLSIAPDGLALANLVIESHRCGFASLTKGDWQAIVDAAFALKSKANGE